MAVTPKKLTPTQLAKLRDPGRVFYRPAILDAIKRADRAELTVLVQGLKDLKTEFGNFDSLIERTQGAIKSAK